uniref:Uncharacterized protein TCIL3000_3_1840 n=1 Tax=Trypanosoma congolense (strain IL3000) TaxID=1068625 RepID=G0UK49_TRYCI|nr:unnamed protein product [Trypanosoma congolense IL3000]
MILSIVPYYWPSVEKCAAASKYSVPPSSRRGYNGKQFFVDGTENDVYRDMTPFPELYHLCFSFCIPVTSGDHAMLLSCLFGSPNNISDGALHLFFFFIFKLLVNLIFSLFICCDECLPLALPVNRKRDSFSSRFLPQSSFNFLFVCVSRPSLSLPFSLLSVL